MATPMVRMATATAHASSRSLNRVAHVLHVEQPAMPPIHRLAFTYVLLGAWPSSRGSGRDDGARAYRELSPGSWPSLVTIIFYSLSFWLLSFPIRVIPAGIVYAIWSGTGIVLITLAAWLVLGQRLDLPAVARPRPDHLRGR
jgi:hypothetical protein